MKKMFIFVAVMLSAGIYAAAMADTARIPEPQPGKNYQILLKSGGTLETDSYRIDKDTNTMKIVIPAGTISINISEIKSVSEIKGEQNSGAGKEIFRQPETAPAQQPAPSGGAANSEFTRPKKPAQDRVYEERDDNGHNEAWWRTQVDEWKEKKLKAEKKFKNAEADWNKYNAATANAASTVPAPLSSDQADILTKQGFTNPDGSARTPTATELNKLSGKDLLQLQQAGVDKTPTTTTGSSTM
ncbi:MAG TPA: hypothetical protein VGK71_09955 [Nitrospirota bacterium]